MTEPLQNDRFRRGFVLLLVVGVTAAFLWMVWPFVMTVMLAAILAGLFHRLYRGLFVRFGGHEHHVRMFLGVDLHLHGRSNREIVRSREAQPHWCGGSAGLHDRRPRDDFHRKRGSVDGHDHAP